MNTARTMRQRVAAIDCGTNSIRLLIADLSLSSAGAYLLDVHREMRIVRLGQDVDATGRLAPEALDRTRSALADYSAVIRACGVDAVRMTATSATRDAENADEFTHMVRTVLGQDPEVIAGDEEASLSFRGAIGDLPVDEGPYLVFDIGGGSTEFVLGTAEPDGGVSITGAVSQNIGSVRITERLLHSDPPSAREIADARRWAKDTVAEGLDRIPAQQFAAVRRVVAVAGTATTMCAAALDLPSYDPAKIHLATLSAAELRAASDRMLGMTRAERAGLGYLHPGRADVIGGGSLVLSEITEQLSHRIGLDTITVSEHDILDGIALSLA